MGGARLGSRTQIGAVRVAPRVEGLREWSGTAAETAGVGELCHFVHGSITVLADTIEPADAVVYASLGDVLGTLDVTIAAIRRYAKQGGYVVVNDCYLPACTAGRVRLPRRTRPRRRLGYPTALTAHPRT